LAVSSNKPKALPQQQLRPLLLPPKHRLHHRLLRRKC
jgi:hypothetical protein